MSLFLERAEATHSSLVLDQSQSRHSQTIFRSAFSLGQAQVRLFSCKVSRMLRDFFVCLFVCLLGFFFFLAVSLIWDSDINTTVLKSLYLPWVTSSATLVALLEGMEQEQKSGGLLRACEWEDTLFVSLCLWGTQEHQRIFIFKIFLLSALKFHPFFLPRMKC